MKKLYILLLLLFFTGCKPAETDVVVEEPVITETEVITEETTEEVTEVVTEEKTKPDMPTLPDMDYTDLDFFEDGYELTTLMSCTDGDTANFRVGGTVLATRFLAVDTPETSNGVDPWGVAAKTYTCNALESAEEIILELDEDSDIWDNYSRLLAWIWVDGELLQYKLVEESYAWVKYLYGDYKYNTTMIQLESYVQQYDKRIWGEDDPDFSYGNDELVLSLSDLRTNANYYDTVTVEGVITGVVGFNAFIQDENGAAIYIYTNNKAYKAIKTGVGTKVQVTASYSLYNGLDELSNIVDSTIPILEENVQVPDPLVITLAEVGETHESRLIRVNDVTVESISLDSSSIGYSVIVSDGFGTSEIRVDKYLDPMIPPETFAVGDTFDIIGNVGQFQTTYQIMIRTIDDIK